MKSTYKLIVKSVTPIHIGSGEEYPLFSVVDNYRFDDEEIVERFIDNELRLRDDVKIEDVEKIKEKMEREIYQYAKSMKNSLTPLYRLDEIDRSILSSQNKMIKIQETMKYVDKEALKPFIPASTIKGIFLTIWFYKIVKKIQKGSNKNVFQILKTIIHERDGKKITFSKILENPNLIERFKENLENLFGEKVPKVALSDCFLSYYKLKVGSLFVGRRKSIRVEVLDEFEGSCILDAEDFNINEFIYYLKEFVRDYLSKMEGLREIGGNIKSEVSKIKEELSKMKENESFLVVGKFTNMYSKSLQLVLNIANNRVRRPTILRYLDINGRKTPIGLVKVEFLEEKKV